MRVALYHPWIYLKGGIERTILELVARSRHQWSVFTSRYLPDDTFPEFRDLDVRQFAPVSVKRDLGTVALSCARLLTAKQDWSGYDALMVSCEGVGNLLTFRSDGTPLLCLCHTPLKIAYDPHTNERWRATRKPSALTRLGVRIFTSIDRRAWKRYRRIFCVSAEVEQRLRRVNAVRPGQTEIAHPGVDVDRMTPSGRREPFFLLPGRIMWTKSIELGLQAFMEMKRSPDGATGREGLRLVVAGMVDSKSRPYLSDLRRLAAGRDDIEFVLGPTDEDLFDLYDRCYGVLFTPQNEDWGIVPLEAMAFGKPVIAVNQGGPSESVLDGETGFLCRPAAVADFAAAMGRLVNDSELYQRMSAAARERAKRFHWNTFVSAIDDYLDTLTVEERLPMEVR
jgi:glycosyltransferase involved in cell wall biosynthesis